MITLHYIAQKAGVSKTTVSLVLNNRGEKNRIAEETRKRVLAVAELLDYSRNDLAIAVKTGKSNVIAFVSFNSGSWEYIGKIMSGILEVTTKNEYSLKIYDSNVENSKQLTKRLLRQRVAGVIFHELNSKDSKDMKSELVGHGLYCASVNISNDTAGIGITSDDADGIKNAVKHLVDQGHKQIAYISIKSKAEYAKNREGGFRDGMREHMPKASINIEYVPDASGQTAYESLKHILSRHKNKRPTALVCISDYVAIAAMRMAYDLGIKIPGQLAVIGFGGLDLALHSVIPIVSQPFEQMGRETTATLIAAIKNNKQEFLKKSLNIKLPTKLIIRKSTESKQEEL